MMNKVSMADIRPFRGVRFDCGRVSLSEALCPPYDVISPEQARGFRKLGFNAVRLELPEGKGPAKYHRAAGVWMDWRRAGILAQDPRPSFYICEERFKVQGQPRRRLGFLAALGMGSLAARSVLAHERTLPKPKADRLCLLRALRANTSPIFGIFHDSSGLVRRVLRGALRHAPETSGRLEGVAYKLWRLEDSQAILLICRVLEPQKILIADGHHRYEVCRRYFEKSRLPAGAAILAYLCPEEDRGLVVLPTHRIVASSGLVEAAGRLCQLKAYQSRGELLENLKRSRNPYAFGLYDGRFLLAKPYRAASCRSGLCVEWLGSYLLGGISPERIQYTHDPGRALALAKKGKHVAVFVKPFEVAQIRRAVSRVGLLPPKSTYFFPKIATGLVFKTSLEVPLVP
jgi:uncharacterized protein (DUF1015 family)